MHSLGRIFGRDIRMAVCWDCWCNGSRVVGSCCLGLFGNGGCNDRVRGGGKPGSGWGYESMRGRVIYDWYNLEGVVAVMFG